MEIIYSVIGFAMVLLGFMAIIAFHELGHWSVARKFKFKTPVFSVGFGKKYWVIGNWFDTEFRLSSIPFGGFVAIPELHDETATEATTSTKPIYQRVAVLAAGPAFNFLMAVIIGWGIFSYYGKPHIEFQSIEVASLMTEHRAAADSGLLPKDIFVSVDGVRINEHSDFISAVKNGFGKQVNFEVLRDGELKEVLVDLKEAQKLGVHLKVNSKRVFEDMSFFEAGFESVEYNSVMMYDVAKAFSGLVMKVVPDASDNASTNEPEAELSGPVGIFKIGIDSFKDGGYYFWLFMIIINVNLAFLNLVPIPCLDGGHIFMCMVEKVRGRVISFELKQKLVGVSLSLIMLLLIWVTGREIFTLIF